MAYIVRNVTKQGSVQICYCTSERIKGKKNPKQTRKYLGMLKAGTNELLLAKTISELSEEELTALKENKIEFYGNIIPSLDPIIQVRRSDLLKDCTTKEVGTTSLLTQISADIKLTTSLENALGKKLLNKSLVLVSTKTVLKILFIAYNPGPKIRHSVTKTLVFQQRQ